MLGAGQREKNGNPNRLIRRPPGGRFEAFRFLGGSLIKVIDFF
jgi:hypothetical protein